LLDLLLDLEVGHLVAAVVLLIAAHHFSGLTSSVQLHVRPEQAVLDFLSPCASARCPQSAHRTRVSFGFIASLLSSRRRVAEWTGKTAQWPNSPMSCFSSDLTAAFAVPYGPKRMLPPSLRMAITCHSRTSNNSYALLSTARAICSGESKPSAVRSSTTAETSSSLIETPGRLNCPHPLPR